MGILIAVLILGLVIIVHELGHFLLAKANGIRVDEFSVGMGPRLLTTVKGETRYSLKAIPFGGSCMMGEDEEDYTEGSFNSKSVWARISVIAAGPIFNFILALIGALIVVSVMGSDPSTVTAVQEGSPAEEAGLQVSDRIVKYQGHSVSIGREINLKDALFGVPEQYELVIERDGEKQTISFDAVEIQQYLMGYSYYPDQEGAATIASITQSSPADQAGLEVGDEIVAINGTRIASNKELSEYMESHPWDGSEASVTYRRDGLEYDITITPEMTTSYSSGFAYNLAREKMSPVQSLKYGCIEVKFWIGSVFDSLKLLVTGQLGINDMAGPVGIVQVVDDTYQETKSDGILITVMSMLNILILISANLGVVNLLPLPAFDGGRLVFLIIEAIRRKPVNKNAEAMVHFVGMMLLMVLMVVILFNDVRRLF